MSDKEFKQKLEKILQKRSRYELLTADEEQFVNEALDKMLGTKKAVRKEVTVSTGDEIRKAEQLKKPKSTRPSFEDGNPKNRGFEGGYDSKADIDEREAATPNAEPTPEQTREDNRYKTDQKEAKLPKEDTSGEVKETFEGENRNIDMAEESSNYEEDRLANILQIKDIVVKPVKKGLVQVGQVLKVYPKRDEQYAVLVKWSDGRFSHENAVELKLVEKTDGSKSKSQKDEEDSKVSPPVKESATVKKQEDTEVEDVQSEESEEKPPKVWLDQCKAALSEDSELSDDDQASVCLEVWRQIMSGEVTTADVPEEESVSGIDQPAQKGEKPSADWLKDYVKSKGLKSGDIIKVTADEMQDVCPGCAEQMRKNRIKYYKVTVND